MDCSVPSIGRALLCAWALAFVLVACDDDSTDPTLPDFTPDAPAGYERVFGQPYGAADVRAFGAHDVWVLGRNGHVAHYDGAHTTIMDALGGWGMYGLDGASPDDLWMVGFQGRAVHFDGARWQDRDSGTKARLLDVWAAGGGDVYAVGEQGTILRHDGDGWRHETSGTNSVLNAVHGASDGTRVAVGDGGMVLVKNPGAGWQTIDMGTDADLEAVWMASPDLLFAVGETVLRAGRTAGGWDPTTRDLGLVLTAVDGRSASDVWAAGDAGLWHFDGADWTEDRTTGRFGYVALDVAPDEALVLQYDREWTTVRTGSSSTLVANGLGTFSITDIQGPGEDAWVAFTVEGTAYLRHGSGFRAVGGGPYNLRQAWQHADGRTIYAVAGSSEVLQFVDGTWSVFHDVGGGERLITVFGLGDELWVGGANGRVVHFDGAVWIGDQLPTPFRNRYVHSISGVASDQVYAITIESVFRFDGARWALFHEFGDDHFLDQVLVVAPDEIYVEGSFEFGSQGLHLNLHYFDGDQWTTPVQSTSYSIHDLALSPDGDLVGGGISFFTDPPGFVVRGRHDTWEFDRLDTGASGGFDTVWVSPAGTLHLFDGTLWRSMEP